MVVILRDREPAEFVLSRSCTIRVGDSECLVFAVVAGEPRVRLSAYLYGEPYKGAARSCSLVGVQNASSG